MLFLGIGNLIDILKPVKCLFCHRYPVSGWILVNKLFYFKFLSHAFDDIKKYLKYSQVSWANNNFFYLCFYFYFIVYILAAAAVPVDGLSSTARLILETLDKMSTPIQVRIDRYCYYFGLQSPLRCYWQTAEVPAFFLTSLDHIPHYHSPLPSYLTPDAKCPLGGKGEVLDAKVFGMTLPGT